MTHYYKIDGKKLPSVTTIISDASDKSPALTQWAANEVCAWIRANCTVDKMCPAGTPYRVYEDDLEAARFNFREVSKEALDVGSEVHKATKDYLSKTRHKFNIISGLSGQAASSFGAFLVWAEENDLQSIATEKTVYGNGWAGTLDLVCLLNGIKYVIDYKSSKAHYMDEHGPQIAAYRWAETKQSAGSVIGGNFTYPSEEVRGMGVLRLDKTTGEPDWKDYSKHYEKYLNIFNRMVELYFARHPRIRKAAKYGID